MSVTEPAAPPAPSRGYAVWLAAILVLAAALRLVQLGNGLWFDEIDTLVNHARLPFGTLVRTYQSQNQHMLYSEFAHVSLALLARLGEAAALRLPAALFGVLSIWATVRFGAAITAPREALLAATLLTVSYHHVWFSQNARGYTMLLCWVLLASACMARMHRATGGLPWRLIAGYAVAAALAMYTHPTAAVVPAAHGILWIGAMWWERGRLDRARWAPLAALAGAGIVTVLLYAPVALSVLHTVSAPTMPGAATEWRSPLWLVAETARGLARGVPGGWVALAAGIVVMGAGAWSYALRSPFDATLLILPVLLMALALGVASHNLWPRFFFFGAGFAALIVVRGTFVVAKRVAGARGPMVATAGLALAAALSLLTVPRAWAPKQDFAGPIALVTVRAQPGDAIVVADMTTLPYLDWLHTSWTRVRSAADLDSVEAAHPRVWAVTTFPERLRAVAPELARRLADGYTPVARFPGTLGGGAVIVARRH